MKLFRNFIREEQGQDGVEYALLIGFVSALIVAGASTFTGAFDGFWTAAGGTMTKAGGNLSGI